MLIDTHCHLNFSAFDADRKDVIRKAKKSGVTYMLVPGVDEKTSGSAITLARNTPGIYAAVGIHPHETDHNPSFDSVVSILKKNRSSITAIGECGLDYYPFKGERATGKKDRQKRLFEEHLRLALLHDLPVIIHCREAFDDMFSVLDTLESLPRGVIHCFSGGKADIRDAVKRKLFFGIDGNITYAKHIREIVSSVPITHLLLETDSPLLTPSPHRGKRNEPQYLPIIADTIAHYMNLSNEEIRNQTTKNAERLFHFTIGS